jgi:hypothetical protein
VAVSARGASAGLPDGRRADTEAQVGERREEQGEVVLPIRVRTRAEGAVDVGAPSSTRPRPPDDGGPWWGVCRATDREPQRENSRPISIPARPWGDRALRGGGDVASFAPQSVIPLGLLNGEEPKIENVWVLGEMRPPI